MTALRVYTFKGIQNLPLYVAREQGYFAAQGLEVTVEYTAGSAPQLAGLARGAYDLVQTAPDNVNIHNFQGVYLSPQQAKALLNVLQQNVSQYESAFGEIKLEPRAGASFVQ